MNKLNQNITQTWNYKNKNVQMDRKSYKKWQDCAMTARKMSPT